jgi:AraC family transcriptional regulator of arabinose operon
MNAHQSFRESLSRLSVPADLYVGTGPAQPVSVLNVLSFCRRKARELGTRKSFHHRFVLCFNIDESEPIDLVLNNVALRLDPGRYMLFFPHQLHAYSGLDDRPITVLFVTFESEDKELLARLMDRVMELTPTIDEALRAFVDAYADPRSPRSAELIVLAAQALLETIIGDDKDSGVDARLSIPGPLKDAMLALSDPAVTTSAAVAKAVGLSEAHLRKLFRKHLGIALGHYLLELRQNRARSLLGSSAESVSRISELCGYASIYAFSRSFRSFNGCTPSEYRRRHRSGDAEL